MSSNEKYNALIALCEDLFVTNGVNGVTMDDIAGSAGISKKTLYTYFSNKEDIVVKVIEGIIERLKCQLFFYKSQAENPVHEIILLNGMIWQFAYFKTLLDPMSLRLYSSAANLFGNFKEQFLVHHLEENLKKGIIAGLYRIEIDIQNTALIYVTWITEGFHNRHFSLNATLEGNDIFTNGIVNNSTRPLIANYQIGYDEKRIDLATLKAYRQR